MSCLIAMSFVQTRDVFAVDFKCYCTMLQWDIWSYFIFAQICFVAQDLSILEKSPGLLSRMHILWYLGRIFYMHLLGPFDV